MPGRLFPRKERELQSLCRHFFSLKNGFSVSVGDFLGLAKLQNLHFDKRLSRQLPWQSLGSYLDNDLVATLRVTW